MKSIAILFVAFFAVTVGNAEETWTGTGTWNNRKYGTSGTLKCVAKETEPGKWTAVFSGKFQGDPFEYTAEFESSGKGTSKKLSGKSKIRGHRYEWQGTLSDKKLIGKYRSSVGYHGEFRLTKE
ncbi:MAG: hypothetical protein AAFX06_23255 [Planctomycetota bacterium]